MHRDTPQTAATDNSDAPLDAALVDVTLRAKPTRPRGPIRSTPHSLSEADGASYSGVSRAYLRQARAQGKGPAFCRFGRAVRYRIEDLDAWINAHRVITRDSR